MALALVTEDCLGDAKELKIILGLASEPNDCPQICSDLLRIRTGSGVLWEPGLNGGFCESKTGLNISVAPTIVKIKVVDVRK